MAIEQILRVVFLDPERSTPVSVVDVLNLMSILVFVKCIS